jgi:hypothetical protein
VAASAPRICESPWRLSAEAVIAARYEEIVNLIETIDVSFPSVAATLRQKASVFDYEGLRGIMSRAKEEIHG